MKILTMAALAIVATATAAAAQSPTKTMRTDKGEVLTDQRGMTLYTFDRDTAGTSNCYETCAQNWPVFVASADAKPADGYTLVTRKDGSKQWAYKDKPLYTWAKDTKPGDATGDGVNQVWHVVKP